LKNKSQNTYPQEVDKIVQEINTHTTYRDQLKIVSQEKQNR